MLVCYIYIKFSALLKEYELELRQAQEGSCSFCSQTVGEWKASTNVQINNSVFQHKEQCNFITLISQI